MIKLLYIAGYGRSGSTLLDVVLGNLPGLASMGEVSSLPDVLNSGHGMCTCGTKCTECRAWGGVIKKLLSDNREFFVELKSVQDLEEPWFSPLRRLLGWNNRTQYDKLMGKFLKTTSAELGSAVLVDSSKTAYRSMWRPLALSRVDDVDVRLIHLLRRPEQVMASCKKGRNSDLADGRSDRKRLFPGLRGLIGWFFANFSAICSRRVIGEHKSLLIRYEEFIENPQKEILRINQWINVDQSLITSRLSGSDSFQVGHLIGGNRMARTPSLKINGVSHKAPDLSRVELLLATLVGSVIEWCIAYLKKQSFSSK